MLGVVDLAAKQGHARPVFLRVVNQLERIEGGAGTSPENPHNQIWVVLRQLFHSAWTVINNLQESRTTRLRHACEGAENVVIDELAQLFRRDAAVDVRIEDFQEMAEALPFRLFAKFLIPKERSAVLLEVVDEGDGVEAEVGAGEIGVGTIALHFAALD